MQLNSVIDDFKTGTYQVNRPTGDVYVNGILQAVSTASSFSIDAVVTPVSGPDLQNLPEAQRIEDVRSIRTATELRTRQGDVGPDEITIGGSVFEVFRVSGPWTLEGETHWRAFASRRGA